MAQTATIELFSDTTTGALAEWVYNTTNDHVQSLHIIAGTATLTASGTFNGSDFTMTFPPGTDTQFNIPQNLVTFGFGGLSGNSPTVTIAGLTRIGFSVA